MLVILLMMSLDIHYIFLQTQILFPLRWSKQQSWATLCCLKPFSKHFGNAVFQLAIRGHIILRQTCPSTCNVLQRGDASLRHCSRFVLALSLELRWMLRQRVSCNPETLSLTNLFIYHDVWIIPSVISTFLSEVSRSSLTFKIIFSAREQTRSDMNFFSVPPKICSNWLKGRRRKTFTFSAMC